jgi:hypothetical protein
VQIFFIKDGKTGRRFATGEATPVKPGSRHLGNPTANPEPIGSPEMQQNGLGRITALNRPICSLRNFRVSDLKSNRLAGLKAFIWSNLCTRHIPNKLSRVGHRDWPDKRATRKQSVCDRCPSEIANDKRGQEKSGMSTELTDMPH